MSDSDSSEEASIDVRAALASFRDGASGPKKRDVAPEPQPVPRAITPAKNDNDETTAQDFLDEMDLSEEEEKTVRNAGKTTASTPVSTNVPSTFVGVVIPATQGKGVYHEDPKEMEVERVIHEVDDGRGLSYKVRFVYGHEQTVTFNELWELPNGNETLNRFQTEGPQSNDCEMVAELRPKRTSIGRAGYVNWQDVAISDDDDDPPMASSTRRTLKRKRSSGRLRRGRYARTDLDRQHCTDSGEEFMEAFIGDDNYEGVRHTGRGTHSSRNHVAIRRSERTRRRADSSDEAEEGDSDEDSDDQFTLLRSDLLPSKERRRGNDNHTIRRSDRTNRSQRNMQEASLEDIYRSDSGTEKAPPKAQVTKEVFQHLPPTNEFRKRHCRYCDTCGEPGGNLIYCQGCVLAYHPGCIGHRTGRDHLVSKVGANDFVLQCRRCMNVARKRDHTAPDLGKCQLCKETGLACTPFRERKSAQQEQKEREHNFGEDPILDVDAKLINNVDCVLFRCTTCWRAFHFHHLPPRNSVQVASDAQDVYELAQMRFLEYSDNFQCQDCSTAPAKVSGLIAWRPVDPDAYAQGTLAADMSQEELEYLVKFENLSYFRAKWMPGAWAWGVTVTATRRAFTAKDAGPKMRTEDAIPEDFLRIDIVLSVRYTSYVDVQTEQVDIARIREVDKALIKFKGLPYEESVWETVPAPEDGERWNDFETAYLDWVRGRYVKMPKSGPLRKRLERARAQPFNILEVKKQPPNFGDPEKGMKMMDYQLEGLNWIYYRWHQQENGILADEMGLGKTIQIVGFLANMVHEHHCWPFLVVVPNATCPNWRREIRKWAPSLKVVTYFGTAAARRLSREYELYPEKSKELKAHIVVTSYECVADDDARVPLKGIPWQGLIVDEGQRLKNDSARLYTALRGFKVSFRILMTGTPLQNNARELFNLLQFLDDKYSAEALETHYADLTNDRIKELHDLIRPFILRRTKAQALGSILPPLGHVIVPVTMSFLQRTVCKTILAQKPEWLKALVNNQTLHKNDRLNMNNVLMQMRKVLCHPFVYNQEIEERNESSIVLHRNLVEASSKLQLLEILLPRLKERGHRCLIFSQFLDMLSIVEDFLDGLGLLHRRLDGTISAMEKQKRMDEFNAPDSPYFAFLLSTRAGGVGINLATADTVILLDPDFNPHQDLQAISRAHRIGQTNKVVCFQLMTRGSPEEKILSSGRKKMALEHVIVGTLDADDLEDRDVASILRHGAIELFSEEPNEEMEIKYDEAAIEKLLDRSMIENTKTGTDGAGDAQFSFARVWENDQLADTLEDKSDEEPDPTVWTRILKERKRIAAQDALAREQALGRGRRTKVAVNYSGVDPDADGAVERDRTPKKPKNKKRDDDSDTEFQDDGVMDEDSDQDDLLPPERDDFAEKLSVGPQQPRPDAAGTQQPRSHVTKAPLSVAHTGTFPTTNPIAPPMPKAPSAARDAVSKEPEYGPYTAPFKRVRVPKVKLLPQPVTDPSNPYQPSPKQRVCPACRQCHAIGSCPLKVAGVEHCPLCGLAHYGQGRTCPHINSEMQIREMIACLQMSNEDKELVDAALKYLRGVKGHLVQRKKKERERKEREKQGHPTPPVGSPSGVKTTSTTAMGLISRGLQAARMLGQSGGLGGFGSQTFSYQTQANGQQVLQSQSALGSVEECLATALPGAEF